MATTVSPGTDPAAFLNSLKLSTTPTPTLLPNLMRSSLEKLGYFNDSVLSNVANLTATNTHTISITGLQSLLHHPTRTYGTGAALTSLFASVKDKGSNINTNEPVLVVSNLAGVLSSTQIREVADAAVNMLKFTHHIRPVRVYVGSFGDDAEFSQKRKGWSGEEGYSLSLLNVVNTDIGGPGMVQLLDLVDWEAAGAVRVERWDGSGWNLIERCEFVEKNNNNSNNLGKQEGKEKTEIAVQQAEVEREDVSEAGASEKGEWESEPENENENEREHEHEHGQEAVEEAETTEDGYEVETVPEVAEELDQAIPGAFEQPEPADSLSDPPVEEAETERPKLRDIKHPSWERTHDKESLLDMISKQANMKLPISKSGNAYATSAAGGEKADLPGEDEYEVL